MRFFVVTSQFETFKMWCYEQGLRPRDAVWVNKPHCLRGKFILPDDQVLRIGFPPPDLGVIEEEIRIARLHGDRVRPITAQEQNDILTDLILLWRQLTRENQGV
jgi:uncharacterized protein YecE (DUF72 family)